MKITKFPIFIAIISFFCFFVQQKSFGENTIKLGKAQLFVDLICFADPEDPEYK